MFNPNEYLSVPLGTQKKKKKNVGVKIAPWFPANYITYIKPVLCELCTLGFKKRETLKINEK